MNRRSPSRSAVRRAPRRLAALLLVSFAAACTPPVPPPHLYVLSPMVPPLTGEHPTAGLPIVMVALTQVPDFLDRPQLVERTSDTALKLVETDQWAERLSTNISRVVAQNLAVMVPADASIPLPVRGALPYKFQVVISLNNLELAQSGEVLLAGRWSITDADGTKELAARSVSLHEKAAGAGIPAAVDAMSHALGEVSRDIAEQIKRLNAAG
jgi:uncharacterized lipoprotein YmbA